MRRVLQIAAVGLLAALLLELVLQVGHGIIVGRFSSRNELPPAMAGETRVLCVGDSFTFGIGAATPEGSYPKALERLLQSELGASVRVVNAGWPGQNSYDIWRGLAEQLQSASPTVVAILAGTNDQWKPAKKAGESGPEARPDIRFRLEWRTARLFRLLVAALRPKADTTAGLAPQHAPVPNADIPPSRARGSGRLSGALGLVRQALIALQEAPRLAKRIDALTRGGRRAEAIRLTERLGTLYREEPSPRHAQAYLKALSATGQKTAAVELARDLVQRDPALPLAWQILAWAAIEDRDYEQAIIAFERVVEQVEVPA